MMTAEKDLESSMSPKDVARRSQDDELKSLERELGAADSLPTSSPNRSSSAPRPKISAAMIIPIWMFLSSSVIIYNNYIYNTLGFEFPVFLVTWHLCFAVS